MSSVVDLLSPEFTQEPYAVYQDMRTEAPAHRVVVKTLTTELHAWVVTRYEAARSLLADPRLSKDAGELPRIVERNKVSAEPVQLANFKSMLFSDPPDHTRLRRIMGKAFTMRRVQQLRPRIERATDRLLDAIPPGEDVDLVDALSLPLPITVIGELLGIPGEQRDDFRSWNATLTSVTATMQDKMAAHVAASSYLRDFIAYKRETPGDDLVSALLQADDGQQRLDDGELLSTIFLVMNAGYETTASMLSNSVYALLADPEQQARLRSQPRAIPAAVEEFLRYESPLNLATVRYTLEPVEVEGLTIPRDDIVFISLAAANRDGARFSEPDALDTTRTANSHLAFGHGIHHCLGAPLARMEGEIALSRLLARFPTWRLAVDQESLRWRDSLQFRTLERLPVRLS
ncbi:cytochrome P450 [Streptomyces sp. 3MP-14]|uniref:Cytochrome P450 n=1 Tax=Streptomyces mimosae TaxID=2586635 RepID=A0A5N6AH71_9ACTN|nr:MULTISPECIES: cytochrome P450 [Streptomyces]KAB8168034.1 cytochrome P450 [Streptomyces mimosae]KAB8177673.1 cytochrome P450 [Streptomyces sp. 3MP-14]